MLLFLFYAFLLIAAVNSIYYLFFSTFTFAKPSTGKHLDLPVSIILCAKNEAENLKKNLQLLLQQNHTHYELILINDSSVDETQDVMEEFQQQDPKISIVNVENNERFWGNKKYALTLGIKKAKYPYLLFTDADCSPENENWISEMSAHFSEEKSIVLGYGGYKKKKNSFLNKLIRFETVFTAIQYFSFAKSGRAYMGVGRNLAYTAEEFYKNNGFVKHMQVRSGDDDLFVNQASTKANTAISISSESFTRSVPKDTWHEWWLQKRRHISTASYYKWKDRFWLGLFYFTQMLFWVLFITLMATAFQWQIILGVFVFRWMIYYAVFYKAAHIFKEKDLLWLLPLQELLLISFQFAIFINNVISKPKHWK